MGMCPGTEVVIELKDMDQERYKYLCERYSGKPFTGDVDDYCITSILEEWLFDNLDNCNFSISYASSHYDGEAVHLGAEATYGYEDSTTLDQVNATAEKLKEIASRPFVKELFKDTDSPVELRSTFE